MNFKQKQPTDLTGIEIKKIPMAAAECDSLNTIITARRWSMIRTAKKKTNRYDKSKKNVHRLISKLENDL